MNKFIKAGVFLKSLFDEERLAAKAAIIIDAILAACSPRMSEIAQHMPGHAAASYKMIERFMAQVDVKRLLLRLFQADAPFVMGDPTEMPRPQGSQDQLCTLRILEGTGHAHSCYTEACVHGDRKIPVLYLVAMARTQE